MVSPSRRGTGAGWPRELGSLLDLTKTLATGGSFRVACARALRRAVTDFHWRSASIVVFGEGKEGTTVAFGGWVDDVVEARVRAMRARGARAPVFAVHPAAGEQLDAVAVPMIASGRVVGVLDVVWERPGTEIPSRQFPFIETLATQLAVWVDRMVLTDQLEARLHDNERTRGQLEAYALDVRETFAAEKQRAEQLAGALNELERTYLATVRGLAIAVEAKDETTGGHLVRVAQVGRALLRRIAPELAGDPQMEYGFLLHDIGKLTVPDAVLGKRGPLTDEEWDLMRRHPAEGRRILLDIPFLAGAREIVFAHHERWDGAGYPLGLRGGEIPFGARIFPLADAFDAMTSERPYRPALTFEEARAELRRGAGTQFWPEAVEAFDSIPSDELSEVLASKLRTPEGEPEGERGTIPR